MNRNWCPRSNQTIPHAPSRQDKTKLLPCLTVTGLGRLKYQVPVETAGPVCDRCFSLGCDLATDGGNRQPHFWHTATPLDNILAPPSVCTRAPHPRHPERAGREASCTAPEPVLDTGVGATACLLSRVCLNSADTPLVFKDHGFLDRHPVPWGFDTDLAQGLCLLLCTPFSITGCTAADSCFKCSPSGRYFVHCLCNLGLWSFTTSSLSESISNSVKNLPCLKCPFSPLKRPVFPESLPLTGVPYLEGIYGFVYLGLNEPESILTGTLHLGDLPFKGVAWTCKPLLNLWSALWGTLAKDLPVTGRLESLLLWRPSACLALAIDALFGLGSGRLWACFLSAILGARVENPCKNDTSHIFLPIFEVPI